MTNHQIIEIGKALLPYLRSDITTAELGRAAHDAMAALNRANCEDPTFILQSCREAKQCLHIVPGCICEGDPTQ